MDIFVARQPIFDKEQAVFGYELLYRSGMHDFYDAENGEKATSEVIPNSFLMIGLETLTNGKRAFVNFTESFLRSEIATSLPKDLMAVEVLENCELDERIVEICKKLKNLGYYLVLDDFTIMKENLLDAVVDLIDMVKVDFQNTPMKEILEIVEKFKGTKVTLLAEKVETLEEYKKAQELGFTYFQGYFFSQPVVVAGRDIPSDKINYLHLMMEINKTEVEFDQLENIIKRDVAITYKLFKYLNSASFGFRTEIRSVKHALVILGLDELKKWLTIIVFGVLSNGKPDEIVMTSILRGRFGELLAHKVNMGQYASEVYLMGVFSMIDAILDQPLPYILESLPISEDLRDALVDEEGPMKDLLDLVVSYEKGDWKNFKQIAKKVNLEESEVPELYIDSVKWISKFSNG